MFANKYFSSRKNTIFKRSSQTTSIGAILKVQRGEEFRQFVSAVVPPKPPRGILRINIEAEPMFEKMTFQTDFNIGNVVLSLSTDNFLLADTRTRTVQTSPVSSSVVQEEQATFDSQVVD